MPPPIDIRRLLEADCDDYRRIRLDSLCNAPDSFGALHEVEAALPLAAFVDRLHNANVLGALSGGSLVGTAAYKRETSPKERHKAVVQGVYVDPAWRHRGVAEAVVTAIIAGARAEVDQLNLTVVQGNAAAIALYHRLGFVIYGTEPRARKTATGYLDKILMTLRLSSP